MQLQKMDLDRAQMIDERYLELAGTGDEGAVGYLTGHVSGRRVWTPRGMTIPHAAAAAFVVPRDHDCDYD